MSLEFNKIKLNKKEFHKSKQAIYLHKVEISEIVISDDFKLDDGVKNFIGYKNGETVKSLCIILSQMSEFIKYFEKNNSNNKKTFLSDDDDDDDDDDDVILKYNKSGKNFQKLLSAEFYSQPVYNEKCIKTRVKTFEDKAIIKFTGNEIAEGNTHYSCIAAICVDSAIKSEKKIILKSFLSCVNSD